MFKEQDLLDKVKMPEIMIEIAKSLIPYKHQTYFSDENNRKEMLETLGSESFAQPEELKLPLKDPESEKFNCDYIYAARLVTRARGQKDIYENLTKLSDNIKCNKRIEIVIEHHADNYDLLDILDLLGIEWQ